MDAYVTVKDPFVTDTDRAAVSARIGNAASGFTPFSIRTADVQVLAGTEAASVVLALEPSRQLELLHERLVAALAPLAEGVHPDQSEHFRPHVSVVEDIPESDVERVLRAIAGWRVNYFWTIRDVQVIAHHSGQLGRSLGQVHLGRPEFRRS